MKAIVVDAYGEPEVMQIRDIAIPRPDRGQVLVRIRAAGVNPADAVIRAGQYGTSPKPPYTPGWDGAGLVEAVGEEVTRLKPGDRVYTLGSLTGTYATHAVCAESQVFALPERVGFSQGAALGIPYATAYTALFLRAGARRGESVLVHGASGGVGMATVQLARAAGLRVFGTASSPHGKRAVADEGAHVLDHTSPGYLDELMAQTKGRGVDVIVEMAASQNLANDLSVIAPRGRVVVVGSHGPTTIHPLDLVLRDASIVGLLLPNATSEEQRQTHAALHAGLEAGELRPVVYKELSLEHAAQSHHELMESHVAGKIVLLPDD